MTMPNKVMVAGMGIDINGKSKTKIRMCIDDNGEDAYGDFTEYTRTDLITAKDTCIAELEFRLANQKDLTGDYKENRNELQKYSAKLKAEVQRLRGVLKAIKSAMAQTDLALTQGESDE